jgi:cytochrome b
VVTAERRDFVYATWEFESSTRRSALGFWGFLFQTLLAVVVVVIYSVKKSPTDLPMSLLLVAIVPVQLGFWGFWAIESHRLRRHLTYFLNVTADVEEFAVPRVSPINARFAPEGGLVLAAQALILIYVALNLA